MLVILKYFVNPFSQTKCLRKIIFLVSQLSIVENLVVHIKIRTESYIFIESLNKISNTGGRCFTSCLLPQFPVSFHSCVSKLHTGCTFYINSVEGTQKSVSALQARKRVPRKKIFKGEDLKHKVSVLSFDHMWINI